MSRSRRRQPPELLLARLRLRLLLNGLRGNGGRIVGVVLSALSCLAIGVFGFVALLAAGRSDSAVGSAAPPLLATVVWVLWTIVPLGTFGTDGTLDPARLALFPLPPARLARGLALAAVAGPAGVAVVLGGAGLVAGYGRSLGAAVVAITATALVVVLSVVTSLTLSTALAAALTSRRGRDVATVVGSLLALAVQGLRFLPGSAVGLRDSAVLRARDIATFTPPGAAGRAVTLAADGRLGAAVALLVPAAVALAVLLRLWAAALHRSLTRPPAPRRGQRARGRTDEPQPTLLRRWRRLPATPTLAVAARDLALLLREPRRRVGLLNMGVVGVGLAVFFAVTAPGLADQAVLLAGASGLLPVLGAFNQFGLDGAALWLDLVAPDAAPAVVRGKALAAAVQTVPAAVVAAVVLAARTGGWAYLPAAVVLGTAASAVGLLAASAVSVQAATPVPDGSNPFATARTGQGCLSGLVIGLGTVVAAILLVPIGILAGGASGSPLASTAAAAGAVLWAVLLWRVAGGRLVAQLRSRFPELLAAVDPRRA